MTELLEKIIRRSSRGTAIFFPKIYKSNLIKIEKFVQLGQISSGLIHDLISPITALNMQIETLGDKNIESIKETVLNVSEYSKLIKSYLSGDSNEKELDLGKTIVDAIKLISYKALKNNVQIQFIRKEEIKIKARPIQIYQIIISLLSNAIESFKDSDMTRKIIIELYTRENRIVLSIKDFGRGIKNTKQIFSPFYTTKKDSGGTGIGLSSVKYIVEQELKGKIKVESKLGEGSVFEIII